jgi:hypothetical protein
VLLANAKRPQLGRQLPFPVSDLAPVERERRFAEGEAVEMAGDRPFERFELLARTGIDPYLQRLAPWSQSGKPTP